VTTDFDVLEDMLVKDWGVEYSFSIRYKHLLRSGQGQQETDKDIDHILGVGSGGDEDEDEDEDEDHNEDDESDNDDNQDREEKGKRGDEIHHGAPTGQYFPPGGYANVPRYPHPFISVPSFGQQGERQSKSTTRGSKGSSQTSLPSEKQREMQAYSHLYQYGPALGPWGQPLPYTDFGGYGPYGMHVGHGAYGQRSDNTGVQSSYPPQHYGMAPNQYGIDHTSRKRTQDDSIGSEKRIRTNLSESDIATSRPDLPVFNHPLHEDPRDVKGGTEAKKESHWPSVPPNTSANEVQGEPDGTGENHNAAALDAELRATQLELKVAQLQAKKRAALSKQMKPK
jgi:hypothetical protein